MKVELIRQLTPRERATAMEVAAFDNIVHGGSLALATAKELADVMAIAVRHNEFYAAFWDEMRAEKWPKHYFETKTLMAAGPLGWLCWADDE